MNDKRHRLSLQGRDRRTIQNSIKYERRRRNREASTAMRAVKQSVPAFAIRRKQHFT